MCNYGVWGLGVRIGLRDCVFLCFFVFLSLVISFCLVYSMDDEALDRDPNISSSVNPAIHLSSKPHATLNSKPNSGLSGNPDPRGNKAFVNPVVLPADPT